ncbi:hypothetical protein [Pseudomonas trivialis]|nr:hypothetical protein [Pseudomonas trivialis]
MVIEMNCLICVGAAERFDEFTLGAAVQNLHRLATFTPQGSPVMGWVRLH